MAKLSLTDQLAAAAAEGNLEKVKELGEKLKEQAAKVKAKPKAKPKKKAAPKPKPAKVEDEDKVEVIDPSALDQEYTVPAKSGRRQSSKYGDEDDNRRLATREPFRAIKRKNTFKDNLTDNVGDINFDKSWYEKTGDSSVKREKVKKVKVICTRCKEAKVTLPNDFIHASWTCEDCLRNIRGR